MALNLFPLSVAERAVVEGTYLGKRPKDIARERNVSSRTITLQLRRAAEKLNFGSTHELKKALIEERMAVNTCPRCKQALP